MGEAGVADVGGEAGVADVGGEAGEADVGGEAEVRWERLGWLM